MPTLADSKYYTFTISPPGATGAVKFAIQLTKKYDGIAQNLGLTPVATAAEASGIVLSRAQAVRQGLMISLRINYRNDANKERGAANIVCPRDKASAAMENVFGKQWGGSTITSCRDQIRVDYR